MKALLVILAAALLPATLQAAEEEVMLQTPTGTLHGTLLTPALETMPVALIIAGSGPTDRNGNSAALGENDSLKMLAEALRERGVATLRYDKRGIAASAKAGASEIDLRFDMYVDDAKAWIEQLKKDERFRSVHVIGHSEGSLIGMIAAHGTADSFVSLAGVGRPAAAILREQLAGRLPEDLTGESERVLQSLEGGKTVDDAPAALAMIYRPGVQPYLISWFRRDPRKEIARLKVPVLIAQGTTDLQVPVSDARALAQAEPNARFVVIDGMNHVLKEVAGDMTAQLPSYRTSELRISAALVEHVAQFLAR